MEALQRGGIQEDMVQYKLFLVQPQGSTLQQTEEHLPQLVEEILAKVAPLLIQYIWQHSHSTSSIILRKVVSLLTLEVALSLGTMWRTSGLLFISCSKSQRPSQILQPELKTMMENTSENRVFLYRGGLHILPSPSKSSPVGVSRDKVPTVAEATTLLTAHREVCQASPKICSALRKRLEGYPEKIEGSLHRAHCFVPSGIAMVLAQRPDLIAPAVLAFYLRDPIDLQACRSFNTFPPDTRVLTSVTFTRCLYAQLQQQQFTPDRRSGFTLTPPSDPHYKAHELGMKLAHGFEILCSKCRLPSSEPDAPVSCNPQWKGFMESLKKNGFFREEMDGSAHYRELTRSAENFFKQSVASKSSTLSPGEEVLQLLNTCSPLNLEEMKKQESQLPPEDSE
ncbi:Protein ecdysoneless like [Dissostichus eleginoides]|uniref:Protein ecdysoneless like n=1 Tax=Dissostichus eleginoides TaxID=100907 RepID=A0AAD9CTE6_DISEL|nr:Protein ecdysoneless like [Dissostichus eleginoides]